MEDSFPEKVRLHWKQLEEAASVMNFPVKINAAQTSNQIRIVSSSKHNGE